MKNIIILSVVVFFAALGFSAFAFLNNSKSHPAPPSVIDVEEVKEEKREVQLSPVETTPRSPEPVYVEEIKMEKEKVTPVERTVLSTTVIEESEVRTLLEEAAIGEKIMSYEDAPTYNGFFGSNNYRIEFHFSDVKMKEGSPITYEVTGKTRYKKKVTPFTGTITIDSVVNMTTYTWNYAYYLQNTQNREFKGKDSTQSFYLLNAHFTFNENNQYKNAGVFSGSYKLDFVPDSRKKGTYHIAYGAKQARNAGILMEGSWMANGGGNPKQLVASPNFFNFANDILTEFYYGGREMEINPRYRALGWDDYWENPEWWNTDEPQQETKTSSL